MMMHVLLLTCATVALAKSCSEYAEYEALDCGTDEKRGADDGHQVSAVEQCCMRSCASYYNGTCDATAGRYPTSEWHFPDEFTEATCCRGKFCVDYDEYESLDCGSTGKKRTTGDQHVPSSFDECCQQTCFLNFEGDCDAGMVVRGEDDGHSPSQFTKEECCQTDTRCSSVGGEGGSGPYVCGGDKVLGDNRNCDEDWRTNPPTITCTDERCCANPLEELCRSEAAQQCSSCSTYGPCLSSIDPYCINQHALDCLPCDREHNLTQCASCSSGMDSNCLSAKTFKGSGCMASDLQYEFSQRMDHSCYKIPPMHGDGYRKEGMKNSTNFVGKYGCSDSECTDCESSTEATMDEIEDYLVCSGDDGDDESSLRTWTPVVDAEIACPDARPCGPTSCVPGTDAKCIVFTVFANTSTCTVPTLATYAATGDYHAFATADDTCRQDGSGRSYYKITVNADDQAGTGMIGCKDDACTQGCSRMAMLADACSTPSWAGGLTLVATLGAVADFPSTTPTGDAAVQSVSVLKVKLGFDVALDAEAKTFFGVTVCTEYATAANVLVSGLNCTVSESATARRRLLSVFYEVDIQATPSVAAMVKETPPDATAVTAMVTSVKTKAAANSIAVPTTGTTEEVEIVVPAPTAEVEIVVPAPTAASVEEFSSALGLTRGVPCVLSLVMAAAWISF